MPDAMSAAALKAWSEAPENFDVICNAFQSTTSFGENVVFIQAFHSSCRVYVPFPPKQNIMTFVQTGLVSMSPATMLHLQWLSLNLPTHESVGKLQTVMASVAGRNVYLRFNCFAGDAMGMNMVSKGVLAVIDVLQEVRRGFFSNYNCG